MMFVMGGVLLTEQREALEAYAASFDAESLTATVAQKVVADAAVMRNVLGTIAALAAAVVAGSELWRQNGDRSAAKHLAKTTGTTPTEAAEMIATGGKLNELPALDAAARAGAVSPQQAAAVANAASADPEAEARLVETAKTSSLSELRDECARTKAAADPDPEARRKRIHAERGLRTWTDIEGVFRGSYRNNPEVGAEIMAALEPTIDRLFRDARAAGRREPLEAYAADALYELICGKPAHAPGETPPADATPAEEPKPKAKAPGRAKVIFRVDLDAYLRGYPVDGEVMEIAGYGPVAASAVRDLLASGDPIITAVLTKGVDVVNVVHLKRKPTAYQQTALQWMYPRCAVKGCNAMAHLQIDHREDWAKTLKTWLKWLDRLCHHHHQLKTLEGWALVDGVGPRDLVSPTDPRHPKHTNTEAAAWTPRRRQCRGVSERSEGVRTSEQFRQGLLGARAAGVQSGRCASRPGAADQRHGCGGVPRCRAAHARVGRGGARAAGG
jgi:hypothetical protein